MKPDNNSWRKPRRIRIYEEIEQKYYIFCEGKQTEPLYFKGIKEAIESNPIYKNIILIEIQGLGKETKRVIYHAEKYVQENNIEHAQIWCVYDKDSFPPEDFNGVAQIANNLNVTQNKVKYCVAWSNQCVEYWFILHFDYYVSDNDRKFYREYLHKKFKDIGWGKYEKNNEELFKILLEKGDPKLAIRYAKKRLDEFKGCTETNSSPATKVYMLVEELAKYLPEEIKYKFL